MRTTTPVVRISAIAALIVILDETLKSLVRNTMAVCTTPDAVGCDYLDAGAGFGILRVENAGSALGFVQGSAGWVVLALMGLLLIPLCVGRAGTRPVAAVVGAGLMTGGAVSNLFDRVAFGSVTDFIVLGDAIVINGADVALLAGMALVTKSLWQAGAETRTAPALLHPMVRTE